MFKAPNVLIASEIQSYGGAGWLMGSNKEILKRDFGRNYCLKPDEYLPEREAVRLPEKLPIFQIMDSI